MITEQYSDFRESVCRVLAEWQLQSAVSLRVQKDRQNRLKTKKYIKEYIICAIDFHPIFFILFNIYFTHKIRIVNVHHVNVGYTTQAYACVVYPTFFGRNIYIFIFITIAYLSINFNNKLVNLYPAGYFFVSICGKTTFTNAILFIIYDSSNDSSTVQKSAIVVRQV